MRRTKKIGLGWSFMVAGGGLLVGGTVMFVAAAIHLGHERSAPSATNERDAYLDWRIDHYRALDDRSSGIGMMVFGGILAGPGVGLVVSARSQPPDPLPVPAAEERAPVVYDPWKPGGPS